MITPGKWEYTADLGEIFIRLPDGTFKQLAIVTDNDADGVLIAAAPELLAALLRAIDDIAEYRSVAGDALRAMKEAASAAGQQR